MHNMATENETNDINRKSDKREAEREMDHEPPPPPAKRTIVEDKHHEEIVPPSLDNPDVVAAVFFCHKYFFENLDDLDSFLSTRPNSTAGKVLQKSVKELFEEAWQQEDNLGKDPEIYLSRIPHCTRTHVLQVYKKWKIDNNKGSALDWVMNFERIVNVDFQIVESKLCHVYDLECFSKRVDEVFEWHTNPEGLYRAPYFCFVQSSGMGKTKIMYEYKKQAVESNILCELLLPLHAETENNAIFRKLNLIANLRKDESVKGDVGRGQGTSQTEDELMKSRREAESIFVRLDLLLESLVPSEKSSKGKVQKVALFFDESHPLLRKEYGLEAFRFRCVRLWLQEKRPNHHVVAVFAGTNSRFVNFLFETEEQLKNFVYASRGGPMKDRSYHVKGEKLYPPYFRTTTMASCLSLLNEAETRKGAALSEYEVAVYHGRPLFALMAKENKLEEKISEVLRRILIAMKGKEEDWYKFQRAWISMLSIRVQLGQTTAELASDLVAFSCTIFCGYSPESRAVRLGHFPDPVCARLAMCMMDDAYNHQVLSYKIVKGKDKNWWVEKLTTIFSTGIVSPEKGDFGEVVVALYMLFCGDLLRKRYNEVTNASGTQSYRKFSVSLDAWLQTMLSGGKMPEDPDAGSEVSVGFIQVCRNSMRSYEKSWKSLEKDSFLKSIFESGVAFYVFPGCPTIDMVVPLRLTIGNTIEYIPMFVSIKCRENFSDQSIIKACKAMEQKATGGNLSKAVCLLISFASNIGEVDYNPGLEAIPEADRSRANYSKYFLKQGQPILQLVLGGGVVARGFRVPSDDIFGLTNAFQQMTPAAEIESELFSCHTFLRAHGLDADVDLNAETALHKGSYSKYEEDYTSLRKAMTGKAEK